MAKIEQMSEQEILLIAVSVYPSESQKDMLVEEMAELIQALNKYRRDPCDRNHTHICEEIADVEIMLEQVKIILQAVHAVEAQRKYKLEKLKERLYSKLKPFLPQSSQS